MENANALRIIKKLYFYQKHVPKCIGTTVLNTVGKNATLGPLLGHAFDFRQVGFTQSIQICQMSKFSSAMKSLNGFICH